MIRQSELRVDHVVASINIQTGGPAYTVSRICDELANRDVETHLHTLDYPSLGQQAILRETTLHCFPTSSVNRWFRGASGALSKSINQAARTTDIIHNHGLWMQPNRYARQAAHQYDKPLVISTRGMLDDWARRRAALKKKLAWLAFERSNLFSASLLHATAESELESIRAVGLNTPVAVIPNGVDLPDVMEQSEARTIVSNQWPELGNKKLLLFLSRLHQKKGVDMLLKSWQQLQPSFQDWHVVLAGPDLTGYQATLEKLIKQLGVENSVTLTGPLQGRVKAAMFSGSSLFVLPTHSENFGVVVAEALAYGLPVITTKAAPWQVIDDQQLGWWIDPEQAPLTDSLRSALNSPSDLDQARRARQWVADELSWVVIADKMLGCYRWLLDRSEKPDWIVL